MEAISEKELVEISEYYKAGYHNEYAHKDIERLVNEIYRLRGTHEKPKKVKKVKKE